MFISQDRKVRNLFQLLVAVSKIRKESLENLPAPGFLEAEEGTPATV